MESIITYRDGRLEHISSPILTFIEDTLDKMVSNYGKKKVIKEYIEPVIKEKKDSQDILDFLEFYRIVLSSDSRKD